jgi:hypothetical protein
MAYGEIHSLPLVPENWHSDVVAGTLYSAPSGWRMVRAKFSPLARLNPLQGYSSYITTNRLRSPQ